MTTAQLTPLLQEASKASVAAAAAPAPDSDHKTRRKAPPTAFGKYSILREIGRGGKGVVHEALDTVLNRKVALKTIHSESGSDPKELEAEGLTRQRNQSCEPDNRDLPSAFDGKPDASNR